MRPIRRSALAGRFSVSSGLSCVTLSLVTARARSDVPTVFAAVVNKRRVAGLPDNARSMTPALWTCRRVRLNTGRLLRFFSEGTEHVFAGITAVVNKWRRTEPSRSVTAAFRAHLWCWRLLHERLESQDSLLP